MINVKLYVRIYTILNMLNNILNNKKTIKLYNRFDKKDKNKV